MGNGRKVRVVPVVMSGEESGRSPVGAPLGVGLAPRFLGGSGRVCGGPSPRRCRRP